MIGHILNFKVKFFDSKLPFFILSFFTHSEYLSQCIILLIFSVAYNKRVWSSLETASWVSPLLPPYCLHHNFLHLWPSGLPAALPSSQRLPLALASDPFFCLFGCCCCCFYFTLGFCILTASAVLGSGEWGGDADGWANSWQEGNLCSSDLESKLPGRKNREWWSYVEGWGAGIIVSVFWGSD